MIEVNNDSELENEAMKKIEAVLFISGQFLGIKDLIMLSDMNPIIIRELMEKLKNSYEEKDSALHIVEKNGMWKMDIKPEYTHLSAKMATGNAEFSKAEQGTLALVALKQPIKQSVIIKIRGNKAYDHVKTFFELGLIKKKKDGHTWELSLSDEFYNYFSVSAPEKTEEEQTPKRGHLEENINVIKPDEDTVAH